MKRRQFFSALAAVPVAAHAATQQVELRPIDDTIPAPLVQSDGITHLGTPITSALDRFIDQLSRNKLTRTALDLGNRRWTVLEAARVGEHGIALQLSRGFRIGGWALASLGQYFTLDQFEHETDGWVAGNTLLFGHMGGWHASDTARAFADRRQCGMPHLHEGVPFAAHYIHEPSGLVMRAMADDDLREDMLVIRWDILLG